MNCRSFSNAFDTIISLARIFPSTMSDSQSAPIGRPKGRTNRNPTYGRRSSGSVSHKPRVSIPLEVSTLEAIDARALHEYSNRSALIAQLMQVLLDSPHAPGLAHRADQQGLTLAESLQSSLAMLDKLDFDKISLYAEQSQRNPDQMLIYLVILGLRVYERIATQSQQHTDALIDESSPLGLL